MKSTKIALVSLFLSLTLVSVEAIGQTETGNGWVIRQGIDEKAGGPIVGGERKTIDGQNDVILMFAHSLKKSWVLVIHEEKPTPKYADDATMQVDRGFILPQDTANYKQGSIFFSINIYTELMMRSGEILKVQYNNRTYRVLLDGVDEVFGRVDATYRKQGQIIKYGDWSVVKNLDEFTDEVDYSIMNIAEGKYSIVIGFNYKVGWQLIVMEKKVFPDTVKDAAIRIDKGGIIPMNAYSVSKRFFGMLLSIDILKKMRMGNRLEIRYDNTTYKISLNGITKAMNLMLKNKNMYYAF